MSDSEHLIEKLKTVLKPLVGVPCAFSEMTVAAFGVTKTG